LQQLSGLQKLQQLALSGTAVNRVALEKIAALPSMKAVYVWNTPLDSGQTAAVRTKFKKVNFETGFADDGSMLPLTPPMIENVTGIFNRDTQIVIKHPFKGVDIRYTLDGSEPDSVKSPVYKAPLEISSYTKLTARAFKKGWIGSPATEAIYIKRGVLPDSVELASIPDPKFKGPGHKLLDGDIGDVNFGNGQWLGYRKNKATFYVCFEKATPVHDVVMTTLKSTDWLIFPPATVEVWGGTEKNKLKLLGTVRPSMPSKNEPAAVAPVLATFPETTVRYLKITAQPLAALPKWSNEKKETPWMLLSEIVVN
jgi:hypothetical protein